MDIVFKSIFYMYTCILFFVFVSYNIKVNLVVIGNRLDVQNRKMYKMVMIKF